LLDQRPRLGGADQLYPEYLPKLRKLVADYQAEQKKQPGSKTGGGSGK
jgi:hypothetical protein